MMQVNIHQAKTNLSRLLEQVSKGEVVIISRAGKPIAKLVSLDNHPPKRTPGGMKGRLWISPDFDDPLPDDLLDAFEGNV